MLLARVVGITALDIIFNNYVLQVLRHQIAAWWSLIVVLVS